MCSYLTPARSWSFRLAAPVIAAVLMAGALPVHAQSSEPSAEDLRALMYYIDQNDSRAIEAETERLRGKYPNWTPPADPRDLSAEGGTVQEPIDVKEFWARVAREDYTGARALIAAARAQNPDYAPDPEMLSVLGKNQSQADFDAAYQRGDSTAALGAVRQTPALLSCDRINNAWRLAELFQQSGQPSNAVATYQRVVTTCTSLADVVATLEKANDVASSEQMADLFAVAQQTQPANGSELETLAARLQAGRGQPAKTAPKPSAKVAAAPAASTPRAPVTTGKMGLRGDSRIGKVRSYQQSGDWASCLAASANPRSLEILYPRAWCAYNMDRVGEALAGFTATAEGGRGLGGTVQRDARFGMILSYLKLNMTEHAAQVAASTNLTHKQRVEVESSILDQRGVRAYNSGDYERAAIYFNALEELSGSIRRDLAILRAYAYMNSRQYDAAMTELTRLHDELATKETRAALKTLRSKR